MNFPLEKYTETRGVSLVEVLIVLSLVGVLIVAMSPQIRSGRQVWEVVGDRHADVLQNARIGMRKITRELRQSLSISEIGSDYVEFVDRNDDNMKFQYNAQYLEYGEPGSMSVLSGPVDSLSFTYYEEDGVTTTTELNEIRAVLIQLVTSDSEGKVPSIPLSSLIYIRKDSPNIAYSITDLAMFGSEELSMGNNSTVIGNIGSDGDVEAGNDSTIDGDVLVHSEDDLDMGNNATLTGSVLTDSSIVLPDASVFSPGDQDFDVDNNQTMELDPGAYGDLDMGNNVTLTLSSGDYYFDDISSGNNFVLDLPGDGSVRIFVAEEIDLGNNVRIAIDGTIVSITSEAAREKAGEVYVEVLDGYEAGNNSQWIGTIFAPDSDIEVSNNSYIAGALYSGEEISIDNGSTVYFVPANDDLLPPQFSI